MTQAKRCNKCQAEYGPDHWAHARENCPACGTRLQIADESSFGFTYEHYDSSVDVQFDLSGILTPDQRKEAWVILLVGSSLLLLAVVGRFLLLTLGDQEGFWSVPIWFDVLAGAMMLIGFPALVWSVRRLILHRRAMRRSSVPVS